MENAVRTGDSRETQRSVARYYAALYGDSGTVLLSGGDVIYDPLELNPEDWLTLKSGSEVVTAEGRKLLFVCETYTFGETPYSFYEVSDITGVYTGIRNMAVQFAAICLTVILLAGVLSYLLLRRVLSPLETLKASTTQIARGIYDKRVEVRTRDEIGELAQDFNRMAEAVEVHVRELQQEAERQTMLLAALTHELKTPMTGIKGNAETLLMTAMSQEEEQEALLFIDSECTRVERLSQKLMALISLRKGGELVLKPCPVEEIFRQVQESCRPQLERRKLHLVVENEMEEVQAEPDLLVSLILNLIDNAGKASPPGSVILLQARAGCISVRDFGAGIPADQLDKITQPFYMVDKSRSRKAGGVGLGLALASEIAALHQAKLTFESRVGEGTTAKLQFAYTPMNT